MAVAFFDMTRSDLEASCLSLGLPQVHAKNLFRRAYKAGTLTPWRDDGFPKKLRASLDDTLVDPVLEIAFEHGSSYDGSVKFLVKLVDEQKIEMVLMPESKRITLCVSSQVGCAQACTFCHTGRMGLTRQLTAAEIVGQVWLANRWISNHQEWLAANRLPPEQSITNVVFMGMGEPLDNVEAVATAITILTDPYGLGIAKRRISVSTAGHLDGLNRLLEVHPDARLAISLHSAESSERSKIMPINKRWPVEQLIARLRELPEQQKHGLLIQYTLISGVNDSDDHAKKLVELVSGLNVKINLIPLNQVGPSRFRAPEVQRVEEFRDIIYATGLRVLIRYSKGQDIAAACGQLVVSQKLALTP